MTTHPELIALRKAAREATAERATAEQLAAAAAGRLAVADSARVTCERELADAQRELDALASLTGERDALLAAADQDDAAAAAADEAATEITARIGEIEEALLDLPPRSVDARQLRIELARRREELSARLAESGAAHAAAAAKRELASTHTAELEQRLPAAETAHETAAATLVMALATFEAARARDVAARARLAAAETAERATQQTLEAALDALVGDLDPGVPLLLLPVRLETRYSPLRADGSRQLRIRVYHDDVHQDSHQRGLTATELTSGQTFWTDLWRAGRTAAGEQRRRAGWQRLVQRHGPGRSRYITHELQPTNPSDRPPDPLADGTPLPSTKLPAFPTPPIAPATWTRAPHTTVLPDRWLAIGYADERRVFAQWGEIIPRPLPTGPSPTDDLTDPADPGEGMRWMVDFTAAVEVGMGIVVRLGPGDPKELDRLIVLGVQGSTTAEEGAAAVQGLLDAHAYTWGLDLVPQGTPTNNDEQQPAGYTAHSAPPTEVATVASAPAAAADGSDAAALAASLGFADPAAALWRTPHAAGTDQRDARAMAAALWPGTWGYYLRQMLAPALDGRSLEQWRRFTLDTVRGRGPLPALRTGDQPYGVLPTTALRRWQPAGSAPELVLLHLDRAGSSGHRVLWDLGTGGGWAAATDHAAAPPFTPTAGDPVDLALHDVDADGRPELVLLDAPAAAAASYWVGPAIAADGAADGDWRGPFPTPFATGLTDGAGLAVGPDGTLWSARLLTQRGRAQLAVARGIGLGPDGVRSWAPTSSVDLGFPPVGRLVGLAAATERLVALFATDTGGRVELSCRVGTFARRGAVQWSPSAALPIDQAAPLGAVGATLRDFDGDGVDELVVHAAAPGSGWQLWIGSAFTDDGEAKGGWTGPVDAGTLPAGASGGAAIADIARAPGVSLDSATGLVNLLVEARALWLSAAASGKVPYVGRGDPDRDILDILASDALSSSVAARRLLGRVFQDALWTFAGAPLPDGVWSKVAQRCTTQLQGLGLNVSTRLDNAAYVETPVEWRHPWIQAGPLNETGVLDEDYLKWAAAMAPAELHDYAGIADPDVLLLHLVRHSTLQAYADVAMRELPPPAGPWREPELVDIGRFVDRDPVLENDTLTSWRYIHLPQQGRDLGKEARALSDAGDPRAADLTEVRKALIWLASRPPAALERLLAESLDLAGHRLDAWLTAVSTARLRELRAQRPAGLHIGGYGIVEDLAPAAGGPSSGYVHAPSIAHATTAAVLRSGHLTHRSGPGAGTFTVDLSSRRVRAALELADGVRTGQPLGALLGYRFERSLQDHLTLPLARHIAAFRQLAPLAAGKLIDTPPGTAVEAVAARNVVDGLALVRLTQQAGIPWGTTPPGQPVALPAAGSAEQKALLVALSELEAGLDALSDLSIAESVHQAAQGNATRAGATLDALSRGELPPVEHEVARAARSGVGASHRVIVVLEPPAADDPETARWARPGASGFGVRGDAEPRLNAWVARLLGDPADVKWSASYPPAAGGAGGPTATFTLRDIGLSPLDVLAAPGAEPGSDLERRLLLHAARHPPAGAEGRLPRVSLATASPSTPLPRLLEVARAARDLVASSRPCEPADLLAQGEAADSPDPAELATRLAAAAATIETALAALRGHFRLAQPSTARAAIAQALGMPLTDLGSIANLLDLPPGADVAKAGLALSLPASADDVRDALLAVADCGVPGAVPQSPLGAAALDVAGLTEQASAAAREARRRLTAAGAAANPGDGLEALLGGDFRALPVFPPANSGSLSAALNERRVAGDAGPAVTAPWLQGLAEVRAGVGRLERALLLSEALTGAVHGAPEIAQLPATGGAPERWVALAPTAGARIPAGRQSLALHAPFGLAPGPGTTIAGLVVDDWVEVVPSREETTAVCFHHDGPGSCAPQALLLAVAPVAGRPWDVATLEDVLAETVELVAVRSVDPDAMPAIGQFLPALMLACNLGGDPHGDTISTQAPVA